MALVIPPWTRWVWAGTSSTHADSLSPSKECPESLVSYGWLREPTKNSLWLLYMVNLLGATAGAAQQKPISQDTSQADLGH